MVKVLGADHRTNWLLASLEAGDFAALEPHLELVELSRGQVLYEPGDPLCLFPALCRRVAREHDGGWYCQVDVEQTNLPRGPISS
jgi:hypothetical protein